jgi:hypothetical protein|tara:strand:+ start:494 stop:706 length:213 start_codon:yes stop_codon:yes gene_type:complete
MSQLEVTEGQRRYNEIAIEYASKIHRARSTSTGRPVVDGVFPSFDKAGLGVYGEYERMGNQPVTDLITIR